MKSVHHYSLLILLYVIQSCGQGPSTVSNRESEGDTEKSSTGPKKIDPDIYSEYKYRAADGKLITIKNGFPRGGMKVSGTDGVAHLYVVFWSQVINETDKDLELKLDFPEKSFEVPHSSGKYYKVVIPSDTLTRDRYPLFDYGLTDLAAVLDSSLDKPASLTRTIPANKSTAFCVVLFSLPDEAAGGFMRNELTLKGRDLFYRMKVMNRQPDGTNRVLYDKEVRCGKVELK